MMARRECLLSLVSVLGCLVCFEGREETALGLLISSTEGVIQVLCLSVFSSLSFCLCMSVCLYISLSLCVSLPSAFLSLSVSVSISFSLTLPLNLFLSVSFIRLSVCLVFLLTLSV